jgi:hypothetical protein
MTLPIKTSVNDQKMYAITITGMQLKNVLCYPKFYWYAVPALQAAQSASGNIHASTKSYQLPNDSGQVKDTLMTLTVWDSRASTMKYVLKSPAHVACMKQMKNLGSYSKTYHYESDTIPTWDEAKELWLNHSKQYKLHQEQELPNEKTIPESPIAVKD